VVLAQRDFIGRRELLVALGGAAGHMAARGARAQGQRVRRIGV